MIAEQFREQHNWLVMGRGDQAATSWEGALVLKEAANVHSEGIHMAELKHGPLALVDERMPVIVVCTRELRRDDQPEDGPDSQMYEKVKSSLQQVSVKW